MNQIILKPYVTEKSSSQMINNKFTFLIATNEPKITIKHFLTRKYDITIESVRILKKLAKKVRRGKSVGQTKSFRKVIVTLKNDKNIEKIKELF
ncbi:50S ribosomal protein L23 [Candidatus Marinamargulisbacteria bacterium SCGC AG-333-B06]|nr:50S ribosomal protein L23 [Candidatus Marinamargulisbacteria bacterium SCGC AG-333-B06]